VGPLWAHLGMLASPARHRRALHRSAGACVSINTIHRVRHDRLGRLTAVIATTNACAGYFAMVIGMPMRETSVTVTWNSS
jgi:hypothetical protein